MIRVILVLFALSKINLISGSGCNRIKNGIEFVANQNCDRINGYYTSEGLEEIVYFVHLYPDFVCKADFPIEFFFDGNSFPLDGIYIEMDQSGGKYTVSVDMFGFTPEVVGRYGCRSRENVTKQNSYFFLFDLERRKHLLLHDGETIHIQATDGVVVLPCILPTLRPRIVLMKDNGYDRLRHCGTAFVNGTIPRLQFDKSKTCLELDALSELDAVEYHKQQMTKLATHQLTQLDISESIAYFPDTGFILNTTSLLNPWGRYVCALDLERNFVRFTVSEKESKTVPPTWNKRYPQVNHHLSKNLSLSCLSKVPIYPSVVINVPTHDGHTQPLPRIDISFGGGDSTFRNEINFEISLVETWGFTFTLNCIKNRTHSFLNPIVQSWEIQGPGDSGLNPSSTVDKLQFHINEEDGQLSCRSPIKRLPEVRVMYCANPVECQHLKREAFQQEDKKYADGRRYSTNYGFNDDVIKFPSGIISCFDDFNVTHAIFVQGFQSETYLVMEDDRTEFQSYTWIASEMPIYNSASKNKGWGDPKNAALESRQKWEGLLKTLSMIRASTEFTPVLQLNSLEISETDPIKFMATCRAKSFLFDEGFTWSVSFKNGSHQILSEDDEIWEDSTENKCIFDVKQSTRKLKLHQNQHNGASHDERNGVADTSADTKGYGTLASEYSDNDETTVEYEEVATIRYSSQIARIFCSAKYRYRTSENVNVSLALELQDPKVPVIINKQLVYELKINDEKKYLSCNAEGWPTPTLAWFKDDEILSSVYYKGEKELILSFSKISPKDDGSYVCQAENSFGITNQTFKVTVESEEAPQTKLIITLVTSSALIILLLLGLFLKKYQSKIQKLKQQSGYLTAETATELLNEAGSHMSPYHQGYEIDLDRLEFDKTVLGEGAYGLVMKGYLKNASDMETIVAIKSTKPGSDLIYLKALLSELKIMIYTGKSQNIVQLLGAHTADLKNGKLFVIVEYCEHGCLEKFLKTHGSSFILNVDDAQPDNQSYQNLPPTATKVFGRKYENFSAKNAITRTELIKWSYEITNGMEYLGTKNVVHGDLACRNVLLSRQMVAKITDFGLAKQLYADTHYTRKTKLLLPWRSMSIETLEDLCCSIQSDSWSYGETLSEIFTLGQVPYGGIVYDSGFVKRLRSGLRLGIPDHATENIYEIMSQCWHENPEKRPDFTTIKEVFAVMLTTADVKKVYLKIHSFDDETSK